MYNPGISSVRRGFVYSFECAYNLCSGLHFKDITNFLQNNFREGIIRMTSEQIAKKLIDHAKENTLFGSWTFDKSDLDSFGVTEDNFTSVYDTIAASPEVAEVDEEVNELHIYLYGDF